MKYLQEYITEAQTKALEDNGGFFAFSNKQFDEARKDGEIYVHLFGGLYCPKQNAQKLSDDLHNIYHDGIKQDIAENGLEKIVLRELNNHEAYYTRDLSTTIEALSEYPIEISDIKILFNNKNHKINV